MPSVEGCRSTQGGLLGQAWPIWVQLTPPSSDSERSWKRTAFVLLHAFGAGVTGPTSTANSTFASKGEAAMPCTASPEQFWKLPAGPIRFAAPKTPPLLV